MAAAEILDPRLTPELLKEILLETARNCDCCEPEPPARVRRRAYYCESLEAEA